MKATAFNGSPRPKGNTGRALGIVLDELKREGIETELVQVGGLDLHGCKACLKCAQTKDRKCHGWADDMNPLIEKMYASDIILIGSPAYFSSLTAETKALIDRAGFVAGQNGNPLRHKVGASVAVERRAGATVVFSEINYFFLIKEMVVPGSNYWNMAVGLKPGDIEQDKEGLDTLRTLGQNVAWVAKKLSA